MQLHHEQESPSQRQQQSRQLQYTIDDLSKALIRQYLTSKGYFKTMSQFESQDQQHKKINKSLLIKIISMNNLYYLNKHHSSPLDSLIEILVGYLKKKYQDKNSHDNHQTTGNKIPPKKLTKDRQNLEGLEEFQRKSKKNLHQDKVNLKQFHVRPCTAKPYQKESQKQIIKEVNDRKLKAVYRNNQVKIKENQKNIINPKDIYRKLNAIRSNEPSQKGTNVKTFTEGDFNKLKVQKQLAFEKFDQKQDKPINQYQIKTQQVQEQLALQSKKKFYPPAHSFGFQNNTQSIPKPSGIHLNINEKNLPEQFKYDQFIQLKAQKLQSKVDQLINSNVESQKNIKEEFIQLKNTKLQSKTEEIKNQQMFSLKKQEEKTAQKINVKKNKIIEEIIIQNQNLQEKPKIKTQMRKINKKKQDSVLIIQEKNIEKHVQQGYLTKQQENKNVEEQIKTEQVLQTKINPMTNQINPPAMKKIIKKNKVKENNINAQTYQPTKFKFDQNFKDQIKGANKPKYIYQKYNFVGMQIDQKQQNAKIILKTQINYKEKMVEKHSGIVKKKQQKLLTQKEGENLKRIIFQGNSSILPKAWHQGFILSPFAETPYGLKQIEGGPCGIIAAVQCYFLKHMMYCSSPEKWQDHLNETKRQICLVAALTDIFMKVKSSDKLMLTLPTRNFTGNKLDIMSLCLSQIDATTYTSAFEGLWQFRSYFIGESNHGVTILLYSLVLTKDPQNIERQIDCKENPLIGNHGHCTQELVNLFITGKASSNCFDGEKCLDQNYKITGIHSKAEFGFLTIFETLKYIEVGKYLKNPVFPIWIICKEFHYHVIFGGHYLISQNNDTSKFDIIYFDGLYNCQDKILLTLNKIEEKDEFNQKQIKLKDLPLIEQVLMTKWGRREVNWNGSLKIL